MQQVSSDHLEIHPPLSFPPFVQVQAEQGGPFLSGMVYIARPGPVTSFSPSLCFSTTDNNT